MHLKKVCTHLPVMNSPFQIAFSHTSENTFTELSNLHAVFISGYTNTYYQIFLFLSFSFIANNHQNTTNHHLKEWTITSLVKFSVDVL